MNIQKIGTLYYLKKKNNNNSISYIEIDKSYIANNLLPNFPVINNKSGIINYKINANNINNPRINQRYKTIASLATQIGQKKI